MSETTNRGEETREHEGIPSTRGEGEGGVSMEDFYVTIPYGLVVLAGGVAGYLKRGSAASLAAGVGFGAALLLAGALSAWAFAHGGGGAGAVFGTVLQIGPLLAAAASAALLPPLLSCFVCLPSPPSCSVLSSACES
jgi:hypothetical protein